MMDLRKYLDQLPEDQYLPKKTVLLKAHISTLLYSRPVFRECPPLRLNRSTREVSTYFVTFIITSRAIRAKFGFEICQALCFMHQRRVLHRDLKPQNLLVDEKGVIKVATDFGLSRIANKLFHITDLYCSEHQRSCSELIVMPPPIDVWAIGCILAEIVTKTSLFKSDSEIDQLFQTFRLLGTPTEKQWHGVMKMPEFKARFPKWKKNLLDEKLRPYCDSRMINLIQAVQQFRRSSPASGIGGPAGGLVDTQTISNI
ncbi:hypothetical protein COOONC_22137 [Cooperia oncophora]